MHMIRVEETYYQVKIKDGKLYMPVQSDIENIADETLGSCENIYFDPIPLTDHLYLVWNDKLQGWEVCQHAGKGVKKED